MRSNNEPDAFQSMLIEACEAIADEVGAWLRDSPYQTQHSIPGERIELFVLQLGSLLKGTVRLTKTRVLEEVRQERRALTVSLDATQPNSLVALAASSAHIGDIHKRLVEHGGLARLFNGYVLLSEGEKRRLLFPPVQQARAVIEQTFARATKTPSGVYIVAESPDGLGRVTLGIEYPAYHVYDLEERPVAQGAWRPVERRGRVQLVALLAEAYHKGHWFVRQEHIVWKPI
jgi:hypothetical protein